MKHTRWCRCGHMDAMHWDPATHEGLACAGTAAQYPGNRACACPGFQGLTDAAPESP